MEFKRQLSESLIEWKNSKNRKPLVIRGARQTGKTTLLKQFGRTFDSCIYLNLEKRDDAQLFNNNLPATELIQLICLEKKCERTEKTLLFIDEIQNSPKAVEQPRSFCSLRRLPTRGHDGPSQNQLSRRKSGIPIPFSHDF